MDRSENKSEDEVLHMNIDSGRYDMKEESKFELSNEIHPSSKDKFEERYELESQKYGIESYEDHHK